MGVEMHGVLMRECARCGAPCVHRGLCSSKYRLRTSICGGVTCVYSLISSLRWDLISLGGWERRGGMLTSLTSAHRGFNRHPQRNKGNSLCYTFQLLLCSLHLVERTAQYGPDSSSSSSSSSLSLPSYLISPFPQEAI